MGTSSSKPKKLKESTDADTSDISFKLPHPTKSSPSSVLKQIIENLPYYMSSNKRGLIQKETQDWLKEYSFMQLKPQNDEDKKALKELYLISSIKENFENKKFIKANCDEILLIEGYDTNYTSKNVFLIVSIALIIFWLFVLLGYLLYKKYEKSKYFFSIK